MLASIIKGTLRRSRDGGLSPLRGGILYVIHDCIQRWLQHLFQNYVHCVFMTRLFAGLHIFPELTHYSTAVQSRSNGK